MEPSLRLKWWMRVMGVLYLLVGLLSAFIAQERLLQVLFPAINAATHGDSYLSLRTAWTVWGVYVALIGAVVLARSGDPLGNLGLVWLLIVIEASGVAGDAWLSTLGHVNRGLSLPGVPFHLMTTILGVVFYQQARVQRGRAASPA